MILLRAWPALVAGGLSLSLLAACSPRSSEPETQITAASYVAEIESALGTKNFGQAAEQAKAAQLAHPLNPTIHLLVARSEAGLGNAGNAAAAFGRAMDNGLADPRRELDEAAFDAVRSAEPFKPIRDRIHQAVSAEFPTENQAASGREGLRAGDVEIIEDESGTYVRAGDIILDSRS